VKIIFFLNLVKRRKKSTTKRQPKRPIDKRRASRDFKKKQFQVHFTRIKEWRQGLKARRLARAALEKLREERENILPIFVNRKKRRAKTDLDCPLDTCPKKVRLLTQLKRLAVSSTDDESDDNSLRTQLSDRSVRFRSPLRVVRRN